MAPIPYPGPPDPPCMHSICVNKSQSQIPARARSASYSLSLCYGTRTTITQNMPHKECKFLHINPQIVIHTTNIYVHIYFSTYTKIYTFFYVCIISRIGMAIAGKYNVPRLTRTAPTFAHIPHMVADRTPQKVMPKHSVS